jgi:hypothetical protein
LKWVKQFLCHYTSQIFHCRIHYRSRMLHKHKEGCCVLSFGWFLSIWIFVPMPANHPKERVKHSQHGESLKLRRKWLAVPSIALIIFKWMLCTALHTAVCLHTHVCANVRARTHAHFTWQG